MNPKMHWEQVELIMKADHAIFTETLRNFQSLSKSDRSLHAAKLFDDIGLTMPEKIAKHFAIEDNQLFPALLADNPNPKAVLAIAELRLEHPSLLEEAKSLSVMLRGSSPSDLSAELWTATIRFLDRLKLHASKEEQLFEMFPQ